MLEWLVYQVFNKNKTEQEKIDWNWFWKVELPDQLGNLRVVKFYNKLKMLLRYNKTNDDGLPF